MTNYNELKIELSGFNKRDQYKLLLETYEYAIRMSATTYANKSRCMTGISHHSSWLLKIKALGTYH